MLLRLADDRFAVNRTRAWTGEPAEFEEFCDRASEPRAILKIEFATATVGLIINYAELIRYPFAHDDCLDY
jgi:hypothetical protein